MSCPYLSPESFDLHHQMMIHSPTLFLFPVPSHRTVEIQRPISISLPNWRVDNNTTAQSSIHRGWLYILPHPSSSWRYRPHIPTDILLPVSLTVGVSRRHVVCDGKMWCVTSCECVDECNTLGTTRLISVGSKRTYMTVKHVDLCPYLWWMFNLLSCVPSCLRSWKPLMLSPSGLYIGAGLWCLKFILLSINKAKGLSLFFIYSLYY